jgi:hypothetical protein
MPIARRPLLLGLALPGAALAQARYETPPRGSQLRFLLLEAARDPIETELGPPIEFAVSVLRTDGRNAFLQARPQRRGGQRIDWARTKFAREWRAGMMSDLVMVLLGRSGAAWGWREYAIGPTDVPWIDWAERHRLPHALFEGP